jgi:hypothetical protein
MVKTIDLKSAFTPLNTKEILKLTERKVKLLERKKF